MVAGISGELDRAITQGGRASVVANSMTCSSSCARSNPARPLLGLFVRSLSIRRSAASTRSRARSRSATVYWRGSGRVRFLRGPFDALLARMAALSHAAYCDEMRVVGDKEDARPEHRDAAVETDGGIAAKPRRARPREAPDLAARRRVNRRHLIGRGDVHDAVEDERRHLVVEAAHGMNPLRREAAHVAPW